MNIMYFDSLDSTNEYLKAKHRFIDDWSIVYVDKQDKGHGRDKRTWESESKKNLLCSVLIKDKEIIKHAKSLSLLTGVVIYRLLTKLKIKNVKIKWPNDVYVNNQKICGVLLESISKKEDIECLIIGLGLNVNQKEFSKELKATSIALETNKEFKIKKILKMYISLLKKEIKKLLKNKSDYIEVINLNNYLFEKNGYVTIDNKKQLVNIKNINTDNSLNVTYRNNTISIQSDEVTLSTK